MKVEFVAGFSPIVADIEAARRLYGDGLGVDFDGAAGTYAYTESLPGVKHLGLWPLAEAARACFGTHRWPDDLRVPQATVEFEVADVTVAAKHLTERGHQLVHEPKTEPWGQTIARVLSQDGLLVAVCFTPEFHQTDRA